MINAVIYGSMVFIGIIGVLYGTILASTPLSVLFCSLMGGLTLITGGVFLKDWYTKNVQKDGPHWVLEVLDDLGTWGGVSWSDIHAKASVHCNMLLHHRSSLDIHFTLEDLTRNVNTLQEKKVFNYIYHGYHLRMRNTVTEEVIPLEALGLDNTAAPGGHVKIQWSPI